jgi:hypothetical protein
VWGRSTPELQLLAATHYDTPQLDLLPAGITLRRRTGGDDAGWHLKLPVGSDRLELQLPLGGPRVGVPNELSDIVRGVVRDNALVEVAASRRAGL